MRIQYAETDPSLTVTMREAQLPTQQFSINTTENIKQILMLFPNGINNQFSSLGVVESSCNLGEIYLKEDQLYFISEIRAVFEHNRELIYEKIKIISQIVKGKIRDFSQYPIWLFQSHSPLRDHLLDTYQLLFNENMSVRVIHAGLECGCFSTKVAHLDVISIGPNTYDLHSPSERLSISSTQKIYRLLTTFLNTIS